MSSAFPSPLSDGTETKPNEVWAALGRPLKLAGFWTAVVLPFVLLTLIALGFAQQSPLAFTGLVTANFAGLVLGRNYNR